MVDPRFHYYTDCEDVRIWLNEFGSYLAEQADRDYVAARSLYRRGYFLHSAYLAHQSIEKYLKAILLYLAKSTRSFRHDIVRLLEENIRYGLEIHKESSDLIRSLDGLHNVSRYRSGSYQLDYRFIHGLDYFVRDIRPYVQNRFIYKEWERYQNPKGISSGHDYKSGKIHLNGFLEKLIVSKDARNKKMRGDLIWNNPYFGSRARNSIKFYRGHQFGGLPFDFESKHDRNVARYVGKYFKFEPEIEAHLRQIQD